MKAIGEEEALAISERLALKELSSKKQSKAKHQMTNVERYVRKASQGPKIVPRSEWPTSMQDDPNLSLDNIQAMKDRHFELMGLKSNRKGLK